MEIMRGENRHSFSIQRGWHSFVYHSTGYGSKLNPTHVSHTNQDPDSQGHLNRLLTIKVTYHTNRKVSFSRPLIILASFRHSLPCLRDPSKCPDHNSVQIIWSSPKPRSRCQPDVCITIMHLSSMTLRVIAITTCPFLLSLRWQMERDNNIPPSRVTQTRSA